MVAKASIIEIYAKADAAGRVDIICKRSDKLTPVITITVYLGSEDWDAPRKLSDMYGEVDERLRPFLQDFNANVLVPRKMDAFSIMSLIF